MIVTANSSFPRRHNPDGSIESICARCFLTIHKAHDASILEHAERQHRCSGFVGIKNPSASLGAGEGRDKLDNGNRETITA